MNYANTKDVREGDKLVADGGFTCMESGQIGEVFLTPEGYLAISCGNGHHLLDGQVDDETGTLVGLRKADAV